jgi:hypothetical protein
MLGKVWETVPPLSSVQEERLDYVIFLRQYFKYNAFTQAEFHNYFLFLPHFFSFFFFLLLAFLFVIAEYLTTKYKCLGIGFSVPAGLSFIIRTRFVRKI